MKNRDLNNDPDVALLFMHTIRIRRMEKFYLDFPRFLGVVFCNKLISK
jgi:hypothetical protein